MPSFDEHIEKYKHNKSFRDKGLLNRDSEFDDWEIVVIFYTCVHLIEAIMDKEFEYHPGDDRYVDSAHAARRDFMREHPEVFPRSIQSSMRSLFSLSHKARYSEISALNKNDIIFAQNYIDDIESWFKDYHQKLSSTK